MTDTEVLVIKKNDLVELLKQYPEVYQEMETIAFQRSDKNHNARVLARKTNAKIEPGQYFIYYIIYFLLDSHCSAEHLVIIIFLLTTYKYG